MDNDQWLRPSRPAPPQPCTIRRGLVVEVLGDGFVGAVTGASARTVVLTDRRGRARAFGLDNAFVVDERVVRLVAPAQPARARPTATTASGSIAVTDAPARVARASRIWVEGAHDAELVEQVWGDDLRVEGVVVEPLHGADDLAAAVAAFGPGPGRRLGVLLDHLVDGSKESRIAATVDSAHVLITGHPYVDIWTAIKPARAGLEAWPHIPVGQDYKAGLAHHLGHASTGAAWQWLRGRVRDWKDLDRALIRAVERLIDFVTEDEQRS